MDSSIWNNALKLLKFDDNIDIVTYESILCKMNVEYSDNDVLVLAARDPYSLDLVKSQKLSKLIEKIKSEDAPKAGHKPNPFQLTKKEDAIVKSIKNKMKYII